MLDYDPPSSSPKVLGGNCEKVLFPDRGAWAAGRRAVGIGAWRERQRLEQWRLARRRRLARRLLLAWRGHPRLFRVRSVVGLSLLSGICATSGRLGPTSGRRALAISGRGALAIAGRAVLAEFGRAAFARAARHLVLLPFDACVLPLRPVLSGSVGARSGAAAAIDRACVRRRAGLHGIDRCFMPLRAGSTGPSAP